MKKGFTLVELLAVIVILGIIAAITIPKIQQVLFESQDQAYALVVSHIETRANDYVIENNLAENITTGAPLDVYLSTLLNEGYIDQKDLEDPREKNRYINPNTSYIRFYLETGGLKYISYMIPTTQP